MNLLELPVEIQQYILAFLDTSSLIQCSRVCSLWKTLTQTCWQLACLREIPSDIAVEILGTAQPLKKLLRYGEFAFSWESLFLKWNHYHVINKMPHQSFSLPFRNTSSSNRCIIRLSGDFLILAPTVENVRVFKVHIYENGRCVGIIAKHKKPVQDIAVMNVQQNSPYRLRGSRKLSEHDVVVSLALDCSLQISEINCHSRRPLKIWETVLPSDCSDALVKNFGSTLVVATQDRNLFIWNVTSNSVKGGITVSDALQITCPIKIMHMNVWKDRIMCLTCNLSGINFVVWDINTRLWSDNIVVENVLCGPSILMFRNLFFSVGAQLTVVKNGKLFQKYDLWETLGQSKILVEKITALCLKRNLLIVGTQMGEIFVFVVNSDVELCDLKSKTPVNMLKIGPGLPLCVHQEIKHLDASYDGRALHISAATCLEVHVVHWFPYVKGLQDKPKIELPALSNWQSDEEGELSDPNYWFYDSE